MDEGSLNLITLGAIFAGFVLLVWSLDLMGDLKQRRWLRILDLIQNKCDGEAYGLQIITSSNGKLGQWIYATLRNMVKEGLLTSREGNEDLTERGGRPRTYYSLTDKGKKLLISKAKSVP